MRTYATNRREENKDRLKSGLLSVLIWSAILLFVFIYRIKPTEEDPKKEIVTTMLVNFGDNRNGVGIEEPAEQEGSLSSETKVADIEEPIQETKVEELKAEVKPEAKPEVAKVEPKKEVVKETPKKADVKEKILTGNNSKMSVPKKEEKKEDVKNSTKNTNKNTTKDTKATDTKNKASANTDKSKETKTTNSKGTTSSVANSKTGNGDGKGNAAIGNLLKGRGTKSGGQGDGSGIGNNGDPLGGEGNGDSKVGVDRKLVGYIPGTMGRGGAQPNHSCTAAGSITIVYTVDKAGNVVSASRSSGISDPCIVSTSISWVKKYVKAEKSTVSSTGSYKISF